MKHPKLSLRLVAIPLSAALALLGYCGCGEATEDAGPQTSSAGAAGSGAAGSSGIAGNVGSSSGAPSSAGTSGQGGASAGNGGVTTTGGSGAAGASGGGAGGGGTAGAAGTSGAAGAAGSAPVDHNVAGVIVIIGSSTAEGQGPKDKKNSWAERYRAYLKEQFPNFVLNNIAVGGYTTYHMQPSDFKPPTGRPGPEPEHNITKALSLKANAIIINMPTNDTANGYPWSEQIANFDRVTQLAAQSNVLAWVTTTQARNFDGDASAQAKRDVLIAGRDALKAKYGDHTLDFWTGFAEDNGKIKAMWNADGTHMNDEAHALLVAQVIKAGIPEAVIRAKP